MAELVDVTQPLSPVSRLLALPAELRNRIIEEVVIQDEKITIDLTINSPNTSMLPPRITWRLEPREPNLAYTCKALYDEVCSIYYNENTFLWRCDVDDSDERHYPVEQLRILRRHLGKHQYQLRHFCFTIYYLVSFESMGSPAGRVFEIQTDMDRDRKVVARRYSLGGFNAVGRKNEHRRECCSCDLKAMTSTCSERGWSLLELAESYVRSEAYDSRYTICDECELPMNQKS